MKDQQLLPVRISHHIVGREECSLFLIPLYGGSGLLYDYWPNGLTNDAAEFITQHCRCAYCQSSVSPDFTPCRCNLAEEDGYLMKLTYKTEIVQALFYKIFDRETARGKRRKRQALIEKSGGILDKKKLLEMLTVQQRMCYFCAVALTDEAGNAKFHADHYDALSEGGAHILENIVLTCSRCNLLKGAMHGDDFERKAKKLRSGEAGTRLGQMRRQLNRWRTALLHSA